LTEFSRMHKKPYDECSIAELEQELYWYQERNKKFDQEQLQRDISNNKELIQQKQWEIRLKRMTESANARLQADPNISAMKKHLGIKGRSYPELMEDLCGGW